MKGYLLNLHFFRFAASSFFALALQASALLTCAQGLDLITYQGPDFSLDYPADWTVLGSDSGSHVNGSLRITGPGNRLTLSWIRDPGFDLEEILDQIEKAYGGGEVKVISSKRGEMKTKDLEAKTLNLDYEFKGYGKRKLIAVWNSSRSDRLFLASLSSCADGDGGNLALFRESVTSFVDQGSREHAKLGPKPLNGAWPHVLADLLSSYHYKEARTLPGRAFHVQVGFELMPQNGSYVLDSWERIWTDPPEMAAARAGALAQILQQAGYDTRLAQARGEIAVAVLDPSQKWLQVSLNPASPQKMVGVLANGTWEAVMYRDFGDLANDNGIVRGFDLDRLVQKGCEPSWYVELKALADANQSWLAGLRETLASYDYDEYYEENVFDCSNTAQICWSVLQQNDYDAMVDDAAYLKGIMYNSSMQFSRLHPQEGMNLEPDRS